MHPSLVCIFSVSLHNPTSKCHSNSPIFTAVKNSNDCTKGCWPLTMGVVDAHISPVRKLSVRDVYSLVEGWLPWIVTPW